MAVSHFRELEVWQLSMQLAEDVYLLTASLPAVERYGLTAQLQRSAVSIPSNIAEGNARGFTRDYARFVAIAMGSCAELQTQLLLVERLAMGEPAGLNSALQLCERVSQMLSRLQQSLQRRLESGSRVPGPGSRISENVEDY
ncbi:four helix bundle protein [Xanthomonas melonis]|uniref:Four helix bundle protein n=1 Tax=Xanthomonas melonis TaxID=56456 RepID=A0ABS8NRB8_9XANT|nr:MULTISPECIES: four helix bundle protein [Xanthomonas]MCC4589295.1 four helix bundle protein [Xanthomonas sp. NCPPB 1067]MCD0244963.1 four helix bundle protein [Xanthomonas melonis]MCD0257400.1 four helix bundle protein [Xanthomonas melonis]MCD0265620.1 four helix bundle protein [Xanthomonas melonis]MCD0277717.1 four helix bundle protein [Xanthomonas melonis]